MVPISVLVVLIGSLPLSSLPLLSAEQLPDGWWGALSHPFCFPLSKVWIYSSPSPLLNFSIFPQSFTSISSCSPVVLILFCGKADKCWVPLIMFTVYKVYHFSILQFSFFLILLRFWHQDYAGLLF